MRIGWATPFNVRSAIGKFSLIVCEEFRARGHDIEIIRIESGDELALPVIDTEISVIDAADCAVADYDSLIVNFGNHAPYHAHSVALAAQRAPVGIFHDMEMRDFEWGLVHRHDLQLPHLHGGKQELAARELADMVDPAARLTLATIAAMTCGAVIHGPHYQATVSAYCPGRVEVIPLCFPDTGTTRIAKPPGPGQRVAIFGALNDNKQPRRVLEALALLRPSIGPVDLHLIGSAEDRWRDPLLAQADKLGLKPPIFHGYVSDEKLQNILEDMHAICCLRYPVTEGGSASLVTALYRARPLVISDIASYAIVPDDLAHKVSYGNDPEDVADALMKIFSDPAKADRSAADARDWAGNRFSAETYVDSLEPLLLGIGRDSALAQVARQFVPAVTSPAHEPIMVSVAAVSEILDWMDESQTSL
ncbi:MAG: glycosyltransferase family 4 protein [Sphingomonas sp.]|nr:glycosyltransferase family 4 protein [Sphingomonas sp.]